MTALTEIRRGVKDPAATAEWLSWLVDIEPQAEKDRFRLTCANGAIVVHRDLAVPVAFYLAEAVRSYEGPDPDGVPVMATTDRQDVDHAADGVMLDHVRLNCADLVATAEFYRELGLGLTWSGRGDDELDGPQDSPLEGATWMHLSGIDGYLSLSQADWQEYGRHSKASGPPRFIHIGLAVSRLEDVVERLSRAGVRYLRGHPAVGNNLYVNDPDGDPRLGSNVEIIEYQPGTPRSGQARGQAASPPPVASL